VSTAPVLVDRRVHFDLPEDLEPGWNPARPELAYAMDAVSLLMPYAEPYFVATVRASIPDLEPQLAATTRTFCTQEARHHAEHRRFNDLMAARAPGVRRLERWMARTYAWLARTRSHRFNLAFAAGSETIAFSIARWSERHHEKLFGGVDPRVSALFLWHLAEEVEHTCVAFDVYQAVDGSKLRYAAATTLTFAILAWFTVLSVLTLMFGSGRWRSPVAWCRLVASAFSIAFVTLPDMVVSAMPGHHPDDLADPVWLTTWLRHFDPATGTVPLLDDAA
jgi:predicted metal-dependent hydrolase